jgi:hypothetical protein
VGKADSSQLDHRPTAGQRRPGAPRAMEQQPQGEAREALKGDVLVLALSWLAPGELGPPKAVSRAWRAAAAAALPASFRRRWCGRQAGGGGGKMDEWGARKP